MTTDINRLTAWLRERMEQEGPVPEILEQAPNLTIEEAYRIQMALMDARREDGDPVLGYKAALTSKAMQELAGIGEPLLGTLTASRQCPPDSPIPLGRYMRPTLEPEIAMVLREGLSGPGVTPETARAAVEGCMAAVEIGDYITGDNPRSLQQTLVCNTFNGGYVMAGNPLPPGALDLRLEGMVMSRNGEPLTSATGVEVLGDPYRSVAFMANKLGDLGRELPAGALLLTGSIVKSIPLEPGDAITVEFTRLGRLDLRFEG